jgi:hypothetical protein
MAIRLVRRDARARGVGVLTDVDGESEDNAGVVHDADRKVVKRKMGLLTGGEDADVILISKQYNSA